MKIIAINGSPRKNGITASLLDKAMEGAVLNGAEVELVHLYDLNYKGCIGCLSCKNREGKSFGKCAIKDDLTPILGKILNADAIIIGSPIYLGSLTGEARSFMERLVWPRMGTESAKKTIRTGYIYTKNATGEKEDVYSQHFKWGMGESESIVVTKTYPLEANYSKFFSAVINPNGNVEEETQKRKVEFEKDCKKAFEMGARFARIKANN